MEDVNCQIRGPSMQVVPGVLVIPSHIFRVQNSAASID